jgi:MFS family permease
MPVAEPRGAARDAAPAPSRRHERVIARLDAAGTHSTWVLWASLAGMFATTFPITILTVSLVPIAREFGARETTMAWVISAPMLCSAVAMPLLGKLGDLHGHRRAFLLGTAGSTAIAFLTAFAWDAASLIALRTLAAVVGGATQPSAMALIFGVTEPGRRVRAMGWWSMTTAAAPAIGLVAGGPLVEWLGWRVVFVMQGGFALVAFALASLVLRETPRQRVRFDLGGAAALALGVGGLMLALARLRDVGPGSPLVLGALAVGVAGLVAFRIVEARVAAPLVPLALLHDRRFAAPTVSNAFMSASYMGTFFLAPFVLQKGFAFSVALTAWLLLMRTASLTVGSPLGGALGMRIGERGAAVTGCVVMTASMGVLCAGVAVGSLAAVCLGLVLQGLGHGLGLPALTSSAASAAADEDLGIASAVNRLLGTIGAAFGITLLSLLYGGDASAASFARAFAAGGVLAALSLAAALAMRR